MSDLAVNEDLTAFENYSEEPRYAPPARTSVRAPQLEVPLEMIAAIATGLEEPLDIAKRYGFDEESFGALCQWPPFVQSVDAKKAEFAATGITFRLKAALMAENLVEHLYVMALTSETTFMQKLDAAKFLTKVGDLEPKPSQNALQTEKFSIVINMPQQNSEKPVEIDLNGAETGEKPLLDIPMGSKDA